MVPRHNKRPSSNEECCKYAYKHLRRIECGDMLIPAEYSNHDLLIAGAISKDNTLLELKRSHLLESICMCSSGNQELEVSEGDQYSSSHHGIFKPYKATNSTCGAAVLDHTEYPQRIPQHENEIQKCERNSQQDLLTENVLIYTDKGRPLSVVPIDELEKKLPSVVEELPTADLHCCNPWLEGISSKDGDLQRSTSPSFFEDDFNMPVVRQVEDICSRYPYHKLVAIGPDHQAHIPICKQDDDDNSDRWLGTCLIPMPDSSKLACEVNLGCRKDCSCCDRGSIRCVRQHIMKAREDLKLTLGEDIFRHLGFYDMGEDVADNWSEEEGLLFEEVVMSSPAAFGRNFWDYLPPHFPTRSFKDLVSYYFNVFMLGKRALQNRFDPWNVDSDNDEWQESDDGDSGDEEDSGVESPRNGGDIAGNDDGNMPDSEWSDVDSTADDSERERPCDLARDLYSIGKIMHDHAGEHDAQDDSCTSFEGQQHAGESCGQPIDLREPDYSIAEENKNMHAEYKNDVLSVFNESGYDMGHCDMEWDVGYICGSSKSVDFLPTCNVIEEVFGKAWEDAADGHNVN